MVKIVLPGEFLCTTEEFIPCEGTFEENGKIFASVIGIAERNPKAKTIKVIASKKPCTIKEGDIVVGSVIDLKDVFVSIEILKIVGSARELANAQEASLHISKIDKYFVDSIQKKYRIGDIVRAEVIQVAPTIQLSTIAKEFGVVKAFCTLCRAPLKLKLNRLFCSACQRSELRKLSTYYGKSFT